MMTTDSAKAARELLAFYLEAGVDAVVGEEPVNWFADAPANDAAPAPAEAPTAGRKATEETDRPPPSAALLRRSVDQDPARSARATAAAPLTPEAALMAAREQAKAAASLAASSYSPTATLTPA
jgi:hypothetical protein